MGYLRKDDILLVIIGPSGAGKSSVIEKLQKKGLVAVTPSWTTRPMRSEESVSAIEHHFVGKDEFRKKKDEGFFLETVQMFGLPYEYGLPKITKSKNSQVPLIMLRSILIPLLSKYYSNFTVYQIEDDEQKIKQRLLKREAAGHNMGTRLSDYEKEVASGRKIASRVFTNDSSIEGLSRLLEKAIKEDFKIII